ncbi:DUF736 domain-containing protein [Mesorhizobium waimense]|uniref:DUF736 domain-containing protein n=1 Tax=Mesorhizobium waimense TaxID=1300307 RepID=A0A3A5KPN2_9HYPH|nr:DUF736 domain-containing protein [Mesorhizobium waimense]RJT35001.1 DUF736 domain-containing protein [Mesorhizobium waimense]
MTRATDDAIKISPLAHNHLAAPRSRSGLVQSVLCAAPHNTEFGAAWKKTSREGRDYHSVKLDDPSFPAPIYASLVETETQGEFSLIWSRRAAE